MISPGRSRSRHVRRLGADAPPLIGTGTPEQVAAAVVRAIEHNRSEITVAPLRQRALSRLAINAPELSGRIAGDMATWSLTRSPAGRPTSADGAPGPHRAARRGRPAGWGAIARALAERGAVLVLSGRKPAELAELAAELPGSGHREVVVDLADIGAAEALAAEAGDVDVLVANAGLGAQGRVDDFCEADVERVIRVNLEAPVRTARALAPAMRARVRPDGVRLLAGQQGGERAQRALWGDQGGAARLRPRPAPGPRPRRRRGLGHLPRVHPRRRHVRRLGP